MDPKNMNNQSQLISGKDSNRSQPKSGNDTETDHRKSTRGKKARLGGENSQGNHVNIRVVKSS